MSTHSIDAQALDARVSQTVSELTSAADTLRRLASDLEQYTLPQPRGGDAETLRLAATGVRASAVQVLLTACTAVGLAERMATFGRVLELASKT